jgi:hypothetical protein
MAPREHSRPQDVSRRGRITMQHNQDVVSWRSRVPPGVPGAGWVIATIFAFAVVVFGTWFWDGGHHATASQATAHHTK